MSLLKELAELFRLPENSHELVIHVTHENKITVECIAFYEGNHAASVFKNYEFKEKHNKQMNLFDSNA